MLIPREQLTIDDSSGGLSCLDATTQDNVQCDRDLDIETSDYYGIKFTEFC